MDVTIKIGITAILASTLGLAVGAVPAYELVNSEVAGSGGGAIAGGAYSAFTTIATAGDAGPMRGGVFEATAGLERRRDAPLVGEAIFSNGFEAGAMR